MVYKVILIEGEDGYIVAECPAIPGCVSQGKTVTEAIIDLRIDKVTYYISSLAS